LIANSVISASRASDRGFKLFQVDARTIAAGLIADRRGAFQILDL
jgi:hypothetical protein